MFQSSYFSRFYFVDLSKQLQLTRDNCRIKWSNWSIWAEHNTNWTFRGELSLFVIKKAHVGMPIKVFPFTGQACRWLNDKGHRSRFVQRRRGRDFAHYLPACFTLQLVRSQTVSETEAIIDKMYYYYPPSYMVFTGAPASGRSSLATSTVCLPMAAFVISDFIISWLINGPASAVASFTWKPVADCFQATWTLTRKKFGDYRAYHLPPGHITGCRTSTWQAKQFLGKRLVAKR